MPELENRRHETYAQLVARGVPKSQAFVQSGYAPNPGNALTLAKKPNIVARVRELQSTAIEFSAKAHALQALDEVNETTNGEEAKIERKWLQRQLMQNVEEARRIGAIAASNGALKLLGQTIGLFADGKKTDARPTENDADDRPDTTTINIQNLNQTLGQFVFDVGDGTEESVSVESAPTADVAKALEHGRYAEATRLLIGDTFEDGEELLGPVGQARQG